MKATFNTVFPEVDDKKGTTGEVVDTYGHS
jgi:hypothetical protein